MGQAVTFFDNDFAGRIAQKQMQAARAVTDVATEMINVVAFALASVIGSVAFLLADRLLDGGWRWRSGWSAISLLIRFFLPRVRKTSTARAAARAMVTGQVVDTITNIKTVKLFAHAEHRGPRGAEVDGASSASARWTSAWCPPGSGLSLMALAGVLPVILDRRRRVLLWSRARQRAGDIAAAGAISMRIAQMSGWVSFTLMSDLRQRGRGRGRDAAP